jgi:hypothetical protein
MQLWAQLNVEVDSDSSTEDDAFRKDTTQLAFRISTEVLIYL